MEVWDDRQIRAGSEKTREAICRGLEQHQGAGFYFAVPHKEVAVGGGIYMPMPETLLAVRNHMAGHHEEFRRIAESRTVRKLLGEVQGEQLDRFAVPGDGAVPGIFECAAGGEAEEGGCAGVVRGEAGAVRSSTRLRQQAGLRWPGPTARS